MTILANTLSLGNDAFSTFGPEEDGENVQWILLGGNPHTHKTEGYFVLVSMGDSFTS